MDVVRLQRLELEDFRGFAGLELDFEDDLTVLVGRNGAGKSTIVDAIVYCAWSRYQRRDLKCHPRDVRIRASESRIRLTLADGGGRNEVVEWRMASAAGYLLTRAPITPGSLEMPYTVVYRVNRHTSDQTPGTTEPRAWTGSDAIHSWQDASASYGQFFHWFKEMEDLENEQIRYEGAQANPELEAVRQAITTFLPEFSAMRVRRKMPPLATQPALVFRKGADDLPFDTLSEGERTTIAMIGDLARRMVLLARSEKPLEFAMTVVIDELEQHAHPSWQRQFITRLRTVFPNVQFIATTHSPIIVSELEPRHLRVLDDFQLVATEHGAGRDANAVLEDVFGVPSRKREVQEALDALADAVDEDEFARADELLAKLDIMVPDGDPDIVYYRNLLQRLRARGSD